MKLSKLFFTLLISLVAIASMATYFSKSTIKPPAISAGFIATSGTGNVGGSHLNACTTPSGSVTVEVFTDDGTIAVGKMLYLDAAETNPVNTWDYHAYGSTAGTKTQTIRLGTNGSTIIEIQSCGGGGGGGSYPVGDSIRPAAANNDGLVKVPSDYTAPGNASRKYPIVYFFHGNGEGGDNLNRLYNAGVFRNLNNSSYNSVVNYPIIDSFIFVGIQANNSGTATELGQNDNIDPWMDHMRDNYRVDTTRIFFTGLSQGAENIIRLLTSVSGQFGGYYNSRYQYVRKSIIASSVFNTATTPNWDRYAGRGARGYIAVDDGFLGQHRGNFDEILSPTRAFGTEIEMASGGHSNTVWDSAFSWRANDTARNMLSWFLYSSSLLSPTVRLYPSQAYDLSGISAEGKWARSVYNLFDDDLNNGGAPEASLLSAAKQDTIGSAKTFYRGRKGWCILVDLVGDTSLTNMTKKDTVSTIEIYDQQFFDDTAFVYVMDTVIASTDTAYKELAFSRPDSTLSTPHQFVSSGGGSPTYGTININKAVRYLMFRFPATYRTSFGGQWAMFRTKHIRINGKEYSGTVIPLSTTSQPSTPAPLKVDSIEGRNLSELASGEDHFIGEGVKRWYMLMNYYDTSTTAAMPSKFYLASDQFFDYILDDCQTEKNKGKYIIGSVRGPSKWLLQQRSTLLADKSLNLDGPYDNPDLRASYDRCALFFREFARKTGKGNTTDDSYWAGTATEFKFPGINRGVIDALEIGNEDDGQFNADASPQTIAAMMSAVYPMIKSVDPSMVVTVPSFVAIDTPFIKSYWVLSKIIYGKVNTDAFQVHNYSSKINKIWVNPNGATTYRSGTTVEDDSVYFKLSSANSMIKSLMPNVELWISEWAQEEHDSAKVVASPEFSPFSTKVLSGYNMTQSRAILTQRNSIHNHFSGVTKSIFFTTTNVFYIPFGQSYQIFANSGVATGGQTLPTKTSTYYQRIFNNNVFGRFEPYIAHSVGNGIVNRFTYRKSGQTDSLLTVLWNAADSTNPSLGYATYVGNVSSVKRISIGFSGLDMVQSVSFVTPTAGYINEAALNGVPVVYLYSTSQDPVYFPPSKWYLKRNDP